MPTIKMGNTQFLKCNKGYRVYCGSVSFGKNSENITYSGKIHYDCTNGVHKFHPKLLSCYSKHPMNDIAKFIIKLDKEGR